QAAYGLANQFHRRPPEIICERTVGANNSPGTIMHDDVVSDGVDVLYPLALGAFELGEAKEAFQPQCGVIRQSAHQFRFALEQSQRRPVDANRPKSFAAAGSYRNYEKVGAPGLC